MRKTESTVPGVSESSSVHFCKHLSSNPSVLGTGDTDLISGHRSQSLEVLDRKGNGREQGEGKLAPSGTARKGTGFTGLLSSALESSLEGQLSWYSPPPAGEGAPRMLLHPFAASDGEAPSLPKAHSRVSACSSASWQSHRSPRVLTRLSISPQPLASQFLLQGKSQGAGP